MARSTWLQIGIAVLAALDVLVDDVLVLALGLHHEALLGVEVRQLQVRLQGRVVRAVHFPQHLQAGLRPRAVEGVDVRRVVQLVGELAVSFHGQ